MSAFLRLRVIAVGFGAALSACTSTPQSAQMPAMQPLVRVASLDASYVAAGPAADTVSDESDMAAQAKALWRAIGAGATVHSVTWINPLTGDHGAAAVMRDVAIPDSNRICREYRETETVAGQGRQSVGQVCQQQNGEWSLIEG